VWVNFLRRPPSSSARNVGIRRRIAFLEELHDVDVVVDRLAGLVPCGDQALDAVMGDDQDLAAAVGGERIGEALKGATAEAVEGLAFRHQRVGFGSVPQRGEEGAATMCWPSRWRDLPPPAAERRKAKPPQKRPADARKVAEAPSCHWINLDPAVGVVDLHEVIGPQAKKRALGGTRL
jgi:hypothetical protein